MGGGDYNPIKLSFRAPTSTPFKTILKQFRPDLQPYEEIYKNLHQFPGLSFQESHASTTAAAHLRSLSGFEVKTGIGGTGLIGILRNGPGKTVLVRADTDGLPVEELTGLPYASKVRQLDNDGVEKPVMHACGHDVHVTCMMAAATTLHAAQEHWSGTLVVLFQPAEERGAGARAMVDAGLYDPTKFACPLPDVILGQHVGAGRVGTIGTRAGGFASASDSFFVTLYGRGGHASQPHHTIDPVVLAAHVIIRLQTVVSREVEPKDSAVVTVASVHAGMTENIIADFAELKINIRTVKPETREKILVAIKRIVQAECDASNSPKPPLWKTSSHLPFLINDDHVAATISSSFGDYFGDYFDPNTEPTSGSEDFGVLASGAPNQPPCCFWMFGGTDAKTWDEAEKKGTLDTDIPVNHSSHFAPVIRPTIDIGVDAMVIAGLTFLGK